MISYKEVHFHIRQEREEFMDTKMDIKKNTYVKLYLKYIFSSTIISFILSILIVPKSAYAANYPITVKEINYEKSIMALQVNDGSTEVYFSDSSQKIWDAIPGRIDSTNTITMDISWINQSINYILNFKGNKTTGILSVTIPKQVTDFKAEFTAAKGTVAFSNTYNRNIQWRKKDSTVWNNVNIATLPTELSYLYNNGASLVFRLAPVNGNSGTNAGLRPSKEVSVKIPKKTNAPAINVDGSRFSIPMKKGMAYRIVNSDGTTSDWVKSTGNNDILLSSVTTAAMYSSGNSEQKEVKLQFIANLTGNTQVSRITTVIIPIQEGPPDININGITLDYVSSTKLSLQVKTATSAEPFEYTVVDKDDSLIYDTAKWSSITSNTPVYISKTTAKEGSHIYVRKKSISAGDDTEFALASAETDITGINGVMYPDKAKINSLTTLLTTAGVCKEAKSSSYLTFYLYNAYPATVTDISFVDTYGLSKGTVTCTSSVAKNHNSTGTNDAYIITTKITSTGNVDAYTGERLYANITLSNSEVITSTSSTGIILYIYPGSKVNNPAGDEYTSDFKRIYMSQEPEDKAAFKFKIDFGTEKLMNTSVIDESTAIPTQISSIIFDRYALTKDIDYTVEYGSYIGGSGDSIATATVNINVSAFEKSSLISKDKQLPFEIVLNNNEILDEDIYMTLISTAKVDYAPIAWSISQGSLKETSTSTVTNSDGSTSTVTNEVITYTINCTLFDKLYSVGITDVTWEGISILGSSTVKDGKATLNLSNAKINKLTVDTSKTENIVIAFSNGFVIDTGCKLTIIHEP